MSQLQGLGPSALKKISGRLRAQYLSNRNSYSSFLFIASIDAMQTNDFTDVV